MIVKILNILLYLFMPVANSVTQSHIDCLMLKSYMYVMSMSPTRIIIFHDRITYSKYYYCLYFELILNYNPIPKVNHCFVIIILFTVAYITNGNRTIPFVEWHDKEV